MLISSFNQTCIIFTIWELTVTCHLNLVRGATRLLLLGWSPGNGLLF